MLEGRLRWIKFQMGILLVDGVAVNKKGLVTMCYKPLVKKGERVRLGNAAAAQPDQRNSAE